jgi:hypothetical protein
MFPWKRSLNLFFPEKTIMIVGRKTYFPPENMVVPQGNLRCVSFGNMVVPRIKTPIYIKKNFIHFIRE